MTIVHNHAQGILACDFFVTVTASFRMLYVFAVIEVGTRRIAHFNVSVIPRRSGHCSFGRWPRGRNRTNSSFTTGLHHEYRQKKVAA